MIADFILMPSPAPVGTEWLPSDWMDEEIGPDTVANMADLAEQGEDGLWWLRPREGDSSRDKFDDDGNPFYAVPLTPGEAVSWLAHRAYQNEHLIVRPDGTWSCPGFPADANNFRLEDHDDPDVIFETLDELVAKGGPHSGPLPTGEYSVQGWFWGDDQSFVFDVIDGKPTFTERTYQ